MDMWLPRGLQNRRTMLGSMWMVFVEEILRTLLRFCPAETFELRIASGRYKFQDCDG